MRHSYFIQKQSITKDCMYLAYNILFTAVFLFTLPFFGFRMLRGRKYRHSFQERLGLKSGKNESEAEHLRPIWIHALSVGETLSAVPLIKAIVHRYPGIPLVFTTSTETGQQTALSVLGNMVDKFSYYPVDFLFAVKKRVKEIRPRLFVLIETDIWPNFLWELKKNDIPAILVNGRMSLHSFKIYRAVRFFMKHVLSCLEYLGMQSPVYARRMLEMGAPPERVFMGGNLKFDQQHRYIDQSERNQIIRSLGWGDRDRRILIAGSTHAGEEEVIFGAYSRLFEDFGDAVLIVAPRNPERFEMVRDLGVTMGLRCRKLSDPAHFADQAVVLDRMGELTRLYAVGEVAFVGGSLVREGGHNLLEPAAQKRPVLFGPHMDDFEDMAKLILEAEGGMLILNQKDLYDAWKSLLTNRLHAERMGERAYMVWQSSSGALNNYLAYLEKYLN
jgi:3-deoxy-D-manno-octulosonic-acid transferase